MTKKVLWTATNIPALNVEGYKRNCTLDNGVPQVEREPDGTYTILCLVDEFSVASADALQPALPAPAAAEPMPSLAPPVSPHKRDTELDHLHPDVRKRVVKIQKQLDDEGIPMKLFEGFRAPERQAFLYAKGRTAPGGRVTNAQPWESYHQFGLAADFVRFENGSWNWNDQTPGENAQWDRYHEIARQHGMEPLSWERPHVQSIGISLTRLRNGDYPEGGDASWIDNLSEAIERWPGPVKPPLPDRDDRPAMPVSALPGSGPSAEHQREWRNMFGGDHWAYDSMGVYTRDHAGTLKLWRTPGAPITVQEVLSRHGAAVRAASERYDVPQELIVMTIATETARYRNMGFTGPDTFRWEQGYTVGATGDPALDGKEKGDYSAGPMQVLSDTARWMNNVYTLGYDNDATFKFFKNKPSEAPAALGLYDSEICIDVGTAYIRHNMPRTGTDPLLVAAAYNAGGLYPSSQNRWRIRSHGNHLDRAAEWYGDACFVLNG